MKKVLSLVLVIAMILSSFSFAFAAKFEDVEGDYEEAIDTLVALGVITGYEDGTFRPENIVTRAEMAKLIVEILGYGDLVSGAKSNFADTQGHWADAWIALASGKGLVLGDGDGNFRPNDPVSYDEAITMIVRALGYTDDCNELKGMTWPTNFKVKASELDLLDGVKSLAGGADRGGIAQLLFNALEAILVTIDSDGNVVYVKDANKEDKPLLSRLAEKVELKPVKAEYVDPDHKNYKGDVVDLTPYMYQNITVYEKDDVVVYVKSVDSLVLKGTVSEQDGNDLVVEDDDEDEYAINDVSTGTAVFLNGAEVDFEDIESLEDAEVIVVLDGEEGDKISSTVKQDVVGIVARLATMTVQAIEDFDEDAEEIAAEDYDVVLPLDGDEIDYDKVVVKGDAEELEDIKEDDVLTLFYAGGKAEDDVKLEIIVSRATVEGKVTKKSGSEYTIGGKAYKLNADATASFGVGDEGTFFLDYEGKIFAFVEEGGGTPGNYALVLKVTHGYQTTPGGTVLADPKVKVLTAEGEEVTYELDLDLGLAIVDDETTGQTITVKLEKGQVIEYDLDKNDVIDELTIINMGSKLVGLPTDVKSFNLANNAVIFNVPGGVVDDAEVIGADELDDEIDAYRYRKDGKIEVLVVTKGGAEAEGIFALITKGDSDGNLAWDEDEEKEVKLYTAYVDGAKVEYLKHKDNNTTTNATFLNLFELTISGGKLKAAEAVTPAATGLAPNTRVSDAIDDTYFLADDVVVYVLKVEDGVLKFDKVGSKSDIRGKYFAVYDVFGDGDEDYDIVVVAPQSLAPAL